MSNTEPTARMQILQGQILAMALTGTVDAQRVTFCTAGKFSAIEIETTLAMMLAFGLVK